jgi:hypothetical protein
MSRFPALLLALVSTLMAGTDLQIERQTVVFPELPAPDPAQPGGVPLTWAWESEGDPWLGSQLISRLTLRH